MDQEEVRTGNGEKIEESVAGINDQVDVKMSLPASRAVRVG